MESKKRPNMTLQRQVKALVRKNLLFKRRMFSMTFWEAFMPVVFIVVMAVIKNQLTSGPEPQSAYPPVPLNQTVQGTVVTFSPNTSDVRNLAAEVCLKINCVSKFFNSVEDAEEYYKSMGYASLMGVNFNTLDLRNYTLRYKNEDLPSSPIDYNIGTCRTNLPRCPAYMWINSGYLHLQKAIDDALIKTAASSYIGADIETHMMPEWRKIPPNIGVLRWYFPLYYVFVLSYCSMYMGGTIVIEKEKKLKDIMTMMGMRPLAYWLSWCIIYLGLLAVLTVIALIMFPAFSFFKTAGSYPFFLVVLILYSFCVVDLSIVFSTFLEKSAGMVLIMFGVIIMSGPSLVNILTTNYANPLSPDSKYAVLGGFLCLLPPTCLATILERMIWLDTLYPGGLTSSAFIAGNLPLVAMLFVLFIDVFLWWGIAMWLDGVLPKEFGTRLSLGFCFNRKFWKPDPPNKERTDRILASYKLEEREMENMEPPSRQLAGHDAIRVVDLHKEFTQSNSLCSKGESVKAVNGVTLDIYEGQITALLGHNGAGKTTTFNLLSAVTPITSGIATIYGYDVTNETDRQSIREMMGVCPQQNALFEMLSVREHLEFYATLKGVEPQLIDAKVKEILNSVDLEDQADSFAKKLSGGQKRKLSVGMALIGDPKILLLDEPTAGMDPYSRRKLWSLLKASRKDRVILLTTHFMDEADILADRKAIMSKGKIQCCGSSMYLKNKFGIGYQLDLVVDEVSHQSEITDLIGQVIDGSSHKRTYGKEVSYNLPVSETSKFVTLFENLDQREDELTITNYGISMTTLEEVFLKLGEAEQVDEGIRFDNKKAKTSKVHSVENYGSIVDSTTVFMDADEEVDETYVRNMRRDEKVSRGRQIMTQTLRQRFRMIPRNGVVIFSIVFFSLLVILATVLMIISKPLAFTTGTSQAALLGLFDFNIGGDDYTRATDIPVTNNTNAPIDGLMNAIDVTSKLWSNVATYLYDGYYNNSADPRQIGYTVNNLNVATSAFTIHYNQTYAWSPPIALNLLSRSLIKFFSGNNNMDITMQTQPWPQDTGSLTVISVGSFSALVFAQAVFLGASLFVIEIVKERQENVRSLLRAAGVSVNYYFGTYMLEYTSILMPVLLLSGIVAIAAGASAVSYASAAILYLIHIIIQVWLVVLLIFCWSFAFNKIETAGLIIPINLFFSLIFFVPVMILVAVPNLEQYGMILHHVLCFLTPYYSWPGGILMLERIPQKYMMESGDVDARVPADRALWLSNGVPSAIFGGLFWIGLLVIFLRIGEVKLGDGKLSDIFGCMSNKSSQYNPNSVNKDVIEDEDVDVSEEREKVKQLRTQPSPSASNADKPVLLASQLRKEFNKRTTDQTKKTKVAVRNASFRVMPGEVFGLLGPNGAGKSSTLNMIIAEYTPSAGQVSVADVDVHSALSQALDLLGYCPQHDAVWPFATTQELLRYFAMCAGLSPEQAVKVTDYYIRMLKIEEHRHKLSRNLSGGTRRKVSFAVAMMGWPELVLMDEPSTGLDPSSKRFLWDTIQQSFEGHNRAAILTTHYMEEAEALCTRIAIMVNGEMECIGSSQHLKSRFGAGYQLEVKLQEVADPEAAMTRLQDLVRQKFPLSVVVEKFSDRVVYSMSQESVENPALVFATLEEAKTTMDIEEYSFSQSSLEQVFLGFAKNQLEEGEDEDNIHELKQRSKETVKRLGSRQESLTNNASADL